LNDPHSPIESTVVPETLDDLCGIVRESATSGRAVYPFGGRTMFDLGHAPVKSGTAIDMRSLNAVIDYPARDMTITVQAGMTIGRLHEILAAERQRLPVDVPLPDRATLGGAIATNASGFRRFGLGTFRDYIIGISAVNDQGVEIKAGGRVVKNVAGYDLMKLFTGSLGTLGIITQVTLKLKPEVEANALMTLPVTLDQADTILDVMGRTRTRPVGVDLLDPRAASRCLSLTDSWVMLVALEDNAEAVAWQINQFREELPESLRSSVKTLDSESGSVMSALRDFPLMEGPTLSFTANMLSSAVPDFCKAASAAMLRAHACNGIVEGHLEDVTRDQATELLTILGRKAEAGRGNLIVTRCPAEWKATLPIWGRSTPDRTLMKAVKLKLDPGNVFNPGRFVDGI